MAVVRIPHACPACVDALTAYRADDRWFALSHGAGVVRRWEVPGVPVGEGTTIGTTTGDTSLATAQVADGRFVGVARLGIDTLWRWDLSTGVPLGPARKLGQLWHPAPCPPLAAGSTGDGGIVVVSGPDGALHVHDPLTGGQRGEWVTPHPNVWALATVRLPDGTVVVASGGTDATVLFWNAASGARWGDPVTGAGTAVQLLSAVLPDGGVVLCIANAQGNVHRVDVLTGQRIGPRITTGWQASQWRRICPIRTAWLDTVAGPRVATCTDGKTVWLWDAVTGQPVGPINDAGYHVTALAGAGPDLLVSDSAGNVHRFDAATHTRVGDVVQPHGEAAESVHAAHLGDGRLVVAVSGKGCVRRFDARTGDPVGAAHDASDVELFGLVSDRLPDGRTLLVSAGESGIRRIDLDTGTVYEPTPQERPFTVWDVTTVWLPDGRVVIAGAGHDWKVYRWDAATGAPIGEPLLGHPISVKAITSATHPDKAMIISGCEAGQVRRWDATTGEAIGGPLPGDVGMINSLETVTFADGRQIVVGVDLDGGLHQWDPWTGTMVRPRVDLHRRAHLIRAWVDLDDAPWALIYVEDEDTGEEAFEVWRLDIAERISRDPTMALRTVFRDADRLLAAWADPDGSLTIAPWTTDGDPGVWDESRAKTGRECSGYQLPSWPGDLGWGPEPGIQV